MKEMKAIVLAAGRGTRMRSDVPKVLHEILGKPIISHILDSIREAGITDIIVVTGYGSGLLDEKLKDVEVAVQKKLLGSGDAVSAAKGLLKGYKGDILVMCGDTPLVRSRTIKDIISKHRGSKASATILTAVFKDPTGYGRILRGAEGNILKIVEEADAPLYEKVIDEINVGTYCFKAADLFERLSEIARNNRKKEYYLTDVIEILSRNRNRIESVKTDDPDEAIGVNTRMDLARAAESLKKRVLCEIMELGVTIEDPSTTIIYPGVEVGADTVIRPNTIIESDVRIGRNCSIGPFTRIRPHVTVGDNSEVGNFVELVRTEVGDDTKIKHHTYLGDTKVGNRVNIGAGTIVANFDGKNKNKTVIEDSAFIGIGARLIAPVKIGKGATVGAGCVVPKGHNVPKGATVVGVPARILRKK